MTSINSLSALETAVGEDSPAQEIVHGRSNGHVRVIVVRNRAKPGKLAGGNVEVYVCMYLLAYTWSVVVQKTPDQIHDAEVRVRQPSNALSLYLSDQAS